MINGRGVLFSRSQYQNMESDDRKFRESSDTKEFQQTGVSASLDLICSVLETAAQRENLNEEACQQSSARLTSTQDSSRNHTDSTANIQRPLWANSRRKRVCKQKQNSAKVRELRNLLMHDKIALLTAKNAALQREIVRLRLELQLLKIGVVI